MPLPPFIIYPESEGDDKKYSWTARFPESTHQWLLDLVSENNLRHRAEALTLCVLFTRQFYTDIAESNGIEMSDRFLAMSEARNIRAEQDRRRVVQREINELMARAANENSAPIRIRLEKSAERLAKAWGIQFPPPDMSLLMVDKDAAYIMRKIRQLMNEEKSNKIRMNDLNRRVGSFNADNLRDILEKLEKEEYIELSEAKTPGPTTVWITAPVLEPSGVFVL